MSENESNPYSNLPEKAFWRSAVADKNALEMVDLWDPKYQILPQQKVATFGSCFAQHIGRALRGRGFHWFQTEPAPWGMAEATQSAFNYGLFTCRTGNIYTASLLNQWVDWALGEKAVPAEYWMSNGRYIDPFRPRVEPEGFESLEEMIASRDHTLKAFRRAMTEAHVFVFTLGLTESWFNKSGGYEYPMCPGTAGGTFDSSEHVFKNQEFEFIRVHLQQSLNKIRSVNKWVRFLFTVSPVPLTATNSGGHVLVATMESKSILRAVAGQIAQGRPAMDYFPSYEIINSPVMGGRFFEPNLRNVSRSGVNFVMDNFFAAQQAKFGDPKAARPAPSPPARTEAPRAPVAASKPASADDVVCEEALLEAFGERRRGGSALSATAT